MHDAGLNYGPAFQGLQSRRTTVVDGQTVSTGLTKLPSGLDSDGYQLHPALLDACFQVAAGVVPSSTNAWIPVGIDHVQTHQSANTDQTLQVTSMLRRSAGGETEDDSLSIDLAITDADGSPVMSVTGLTLTPITIVAPATSTSDESASETDSANQQQKSPEEIRQHLHERIAEIMGLEIDEVPLAQSLDALGLDSLMAFELRDEMQQEFGIEVPLDLFFEDSTLDTFLNQVIEQIANAEPPVASEDGWVEGAL